MSRKRRYDEPFNSRKDSRKRHYVQSKENDPLRGSHDYDKFAGASVEDREKSPIIGLRKANCFMKKLLSDTYMPKTKSVLDIACGQGGCLPRFSKCRNLETYVGFDISADRVQEAKRRETDLKTGWKKAEIFQADFLDVQSWKSKLGNQKFDWINMQFSVHYFMTRASQVREWMDAITAVMNPRARLIMTFVDWDYVLRHKRMNTSNSIYSMTGNKEQDACWYKYNFKLHGCVDSDEFAVDVDLLLRWFKNRGKGLSFITQKHFRDYSHVRSKLSRDEQDVFDLYTCVVLEKPSDV